jgi:hypothetical protein
MTRLGLACGAAHLALGAAFVAAPDRALGLVHARTDRALSIAVRVLGARHLLEATVAGRARSRWAGVAAGVDALHAASMLGIAAAGPRRRRPALVSAGLAGAMTALEVAEARTTAGKPVT